MPIPQTSGLAVKHVTLGTTNQSLPSSHQNISPQPPFMQHMMLGGANGNYSAQQHPIQPVNVYQQDYAQKCYEEKIFLDQVYNRDPSLRMVFLQNLYEPAVFEVRHYFQSILNVDINLSDRMDMTVLALSDNGACLNFGAERWFQETQQQAVGIWHGKIKNLEPSDLCTNTLLQSPGQG